MMNDHPPMTPDGRPISERSILRGLRINIVAGMLAMFWAGLTQTIPLTMFMEALGASGVMIGLVNALPQILLIVQVPAALLAERVVSRKKLWAGIIMVSRFLWITPALYLALFPGNYRLVIWCTVVLAAVSALLGRSVDALWFSWMADLVPGRMRGRFWGTRQSLTALSLAVAMAVAGRILDAFPPPGPGGGGSWKGFSLVFLAGGILGTVDIIVHLFVPEPRATIRAEAMRWIERIREPLRDPDFRRLTRAMSVYTFCIGLTSLGIVYLKQDFHVTYTHLSLLAIAANLSIIVFSFAWGYALDRMGGRAFGAVMVTLAPLVMIVWFFVRDYSTNLVGLLQGLWGVGPGVEALVKLLPARMEAWINGFILPQPVWLILFANVFAGALFGGIALCQLSLTAGLVPEKGRTVAMAVFWSSIGLVGSLGLLAAGWVMDFVRAHPLPLTLLNGTPVSFHHVLVIAQMTLLWIGVLPELLALSKRAGEPDVGAAFSQLLLANPFRMASDIRTLNSHASIAQRARAVHSLGDKRVRIAVTDLAARLNDPAMEVREEAAIALGSIGTPEAVEALLARLESDNSGLTPQIVRGLRNAAAARDNMKLVPVLLRILQNTDSATVAETARTLGKLGYRDAVRPLMDLLGKSRDNRIVSAASEALARLGEIAAADIILPRMRETADPVLRHSLAVAIGDLLGEPESFYKALMQEQRQRGSAVDRLLKNLQRDIARHCRNAPKAGRQELASRVSALQKLYDSENFAACVPALFDLAVECAAARWNIKAGDSESFVEQLARREARLGAIARCLCALRGNGGPAQAGRPDFVDVLLGIYALACLATRGADPEKSRLWPGLRSSRHAC